MQLVLEKRAERSTKIAILSPLLAIALTLVTMSILFAILGKNPVTALYVYFVEPLTDAFTLQEIAVKATPLVMIAIGLSFCYLANVWNIGAEGQFIMGAVCGSWLAVVTNGTGAGPWVLPAMFDNLTVAENVALGLDGKESFAAMSARLAQVSQDYGLPLDPKREVWRLSVGERQRIEIVRALMQNPKLLILDEPTAVLTPQEADQLFVVLERLRSEGRALLYISHKLDEVKRLCNTATILRGGKKISTCNPREETAASLARMMVGADIGEVKAKSARATTVPRLVVLDLSLAPDDPHGTYLRNISIEVKGGEILGIAGVAGNGQDEFFAALSGERLSPGEGNVIYDGEAAGLMSVTQRRRLGAAFVPEERLGHGTAPRMKLSENALLTGHAASGMVHHGFVDKPATLATVDKTTTTFDVRKAKRDPEAVSLSGGNLQKFIVGREILREPGVLIVSQPTWGVDAGAAAVIRQALLDLSSRGTAVLVISQDLDELAEIADRIAVMFHGRLSEPLDAASATRERLGLLMGGSSAGQKEATHAVGA